MISQRRSQHHTADSLADCKLIFRKLEMKIDGILVVFIEQGLCSRSNFSTKIINHINIVYTGIYILFYSSLQNIFFTSLYEIDELETCVFQEKKYSNPYQIFGCKALYFTIHRLP